MLVGLDVNRIDFQHTNDSPYGGRSTVDPFVFDPGLYASPVAYTPRYRTRTNTHALFAEDMDAAGIAVRCDLTAVQQRTGLRHVAQVGCRARHREHQLRVSVYADASLHPELPSVVLPGLVHIRVSCMACVLGRTRRRV